EVLLVGREDNKDFVLNDFLKCVFNGCQDVDIKKIPIAEQTSLSM
ncbi:TPA: phage tail protein, partial [Streptococcus pyogenes]|nr:phage tail protein [Streptococcus pyogenes]